MSQCEGFPKDARLLRPAEFRAVFAQALSSRDACFTILARHDLDSPGRLGLAIAKKCARRAVDRNRLKRIVRESFRRHRSLLYHLDCVALCRAGTAALPNARLFASLEAHWQRLIRQRPCVGS